MSGETRVTLRTRPGILSATGMLRQSWEVEYDGGKVGGVRMPNCFR
jgi:hypothetical protein